tara:strand:+ start:4168 stop:4365 length:198 start_codon:yes stop_codon:yes gene_type:complete
MDLENDYKAYFIFGGICLLCALLTIIGGVDTMGIWMDAMYPLFLLFSIACFSIGWIRYNKKDKKT